jgi:RimJ/RimL family protein N-acetyltransferase
MVFFQDLEYLELNENYLEFVRNCRNASRDAFIDNSYITEEQQKTWYKNLSMLLKFYVVKDSNNPIGYFSITLNKKHNSAEIGIALLPRECRKGYGLRILSFVSHYCFNILGLNRLWASVLDSNKATLRLWEKAGWTHEGILRQACYINEAYCDLYIMGLLKDELL